MGSGGVADKAGHGRGSVIVRTKLTPDRKYLLVFHNSGKVNSSLARVEKLDARTGAVNLNWVRSVKLRNG